VDRAKRREITAQAAFPVEWDGESRPPQGADLTIGGFAYRVDAAAFFQAHPAAAAELLADPSLELPPATRLLELYCGMGLFTVALARRVTSVVAVEGDPGCTALFAANIRRAGAGNVRHAESSVESWLTARAGSLGEFDALLLDPPRTGLGAGVRYVLASAPFRDLLYLSCDIPTQRRDLLAWLAGGAFTMAGLTVFDFFPNTFHIECLARLHGPGPR
jgi:23S rRNA (uracil1939-C5)-methyltransferase